MSFQPVLISDGLAGWRFLTRTLPEQSAVFAKQAQSQRDIDYFADNIAKIETPAQLVADYRLLSVALGAFGLSEDLGSRAFIERVLTEGGDSETALANRLSDSRYKALAQAFGFDSARPNTVEDGFADKINTRFAAQAFEVAVGRQDDTLRIALYARRVMSEVVLEGATEDASWYRIMGEAPLRRVMENALSLPAGFGQIDLDQQLSVFKTRFAERFSAQGISALGDEALLEQVVDRFVLRQQVNQVGQYNPASVALSLLQSTGRR